GPGDVVSYWATVTDNDAVRGPKESRTAIYQARFPGVAEIFAQVTGDQEEQRSSLEDVAREERDLQQKTEELSRRSARSQDLSWEQKQEVSETLDRQRELTSKLGDVVKALEDNAETAQQNNLLSQEILDRMKELSDLMKQVATPDMLRAMQEMQQ